MDQFGNVEEFYDGISGTLRTAYRALDPAQFDKAVRLLLRAPRVAASGCGQSACACMYLVHLLCRIQRPARFLHPSEALHGDAGFLLKGDAMVLASLEGRTTELLEIEETCRANRVRVIAVTADLSSPLAQRADILLRLSAPCRWESTAARKSAHFTLETVLFSALQSAMLDRMGRVHAESPADRGSGTYEPSWSCGPSD